MSTSMTLLQLKTAVRQRADMVNSTFIADDELASYINQSYFELYDLLVQKYGDDYFVKLPAYQFTTNGTDAFYSLPADFYKMLGLDLAMSPNQTDSYVTIKPFNFSDRNRYAVPNFQSFYGVTNVRYRLEQDSLWLTPTPAANQVFQLWYVPKLQTLDNDSAVVDGISGWTEYIICDAAMKCLQKEESDVSVVAAQKAALIARIESAGENRDAGMPMIVSDGQYSDMWWPSGSGSGSGGTY